MVCLLAALWPGAARAVEGGPAVEAKAALLMERETGAVLWEENAHDRLEPASVTKIMTLLLTAEAVDAGTLALDDVVTASARAAGMGGSQVYLKEGEQMTVSDLLKAVAVASGNDGAVALAEHLAGSEEAFVDRMNRRAAELGMADTHFANCTGLPAPEHYTSVYDIAIMSRELLSHAFIRDYTGIWMDTLRDGAFQLANTNKLIYYYEGATGLKAGFTDTALYCLSASAQREGVEYIAVILGAPSSAVRFDGAKALLNYAFANYTLAEAKPDRALPPVNVRLGQQSTVQPVPARETRLLVTREEAGQVTARTELADSVDAPVEEGDKLGELVILVGDEERQRVDLVADFPVKRLTFTGVLAGFLKGLCMAA